jgi:hypothetical protein
MLACISAALRGNPEGKLADAVSGSDELMFIFDGNITS